RPNEPCRHQALHRFARGTTPDPHSSTLPPPRPASFARSHRLRAGAATPRVSRSNCPSPGSRPTAGCRRASRFTYGELAADAARIPVPENVQLKRPGEFKLIGTPAKRLDTPAKVNGTAVYGIDVRPPGVKIATLAQSPVFGGRVKSVDDTAAKSVKGVRQIVR